MDDNRTLIFLHLHRTGGISLSTILRRYYNSDVEFKLDEHTEKYETGVARFKSLSQEDRDRIKLLRGHMPFGMHVYFSNPCDYITIIRDPIERIISEYNSRRLNPAKYRNFKQADMSSLKNFVNSNIDSIDNYQTRVLSGNWGKEQEVGAYVTPLQEKDFEKAKDNLKNYFKVVGTTERLDEVILVMAKIFGWENPYYFKKRRVLSRDVVFAEEIEEVKEIIKKKNKFDLELYRIANETLNGLIQQHYGYYFRINLFKYRIINKFLSFGYYDKKTVLEHGAIKKARYARKLIMQFRLFMRKIAVKFKLWK
jgi:hypothetical protein